jgi:para-nitrobenzyl esterase
MQVGGLQGPGRGGEPFGASIADSFGEPVGDEDCLTLNLWRPREPAGALPIVVFLHGGANVAGYSGDPLYHGARLATRLGAVVVTLNYRLGALGWFTHAVLEAGADAESASGNFGLLDIIAALEFVRSNAAAFGGDSADVTLIGQSAGAVNALALMTSPRGRGLFHRVVALSGALIAIPRAAQHAYADQVVRELLMADGSATDSSGAARLIDERGGNWLRTYLHTRSGAELVTAAARAGGGGLPTADGAVLPLDPTRAVAAGDHLRVPVLIGTTAEEGKFFVQGVYRMSTADRFRAMLATDSGGRPSLALTDVLLPELATARGFEAAAAEAGADVNRLIRGTVELFGPRLPLFAMEFAWARQAEPWRTLIGASHGIDLPFLFESFGPSLYGVSFSERNLPGRERLVEALAASVSAFMRTGDPSSAALGARWDPWSAGRRWVVLDADDRRLRVRTVVR